jgi:phenylpropionate dioxygenase-like ring-hydroxylating dioxygenase large terminal subunit
MADGRWPSGSARFPFAPFPRGWYNVVPSDQVQAGQVARLHLLGRELVCFRGVSGAVTVADAYCPHLGAHLGVGGYVRGDDIVCPFHGWCFDARGENVDIPYADRVNRRARLAVYATRELAGMVFVWFDPEGGPPTWHLPELAELDSEDHLLVCPPEGCWRFASHPQEVLENVVDVAHFKFVHGVGAFGGLEVEIEGPRCRTAAEVTFTTPRGPTEGAVVSELWGLGFDVVRQRGLGAPACGVLTVTPVDGIQVEARYMFVLPKDPATSEPTRYGKGLIAEFMRQIVQDIPIWEAKVYRETPSLAGGEGPIMEYRRWARQFYPEVQGQAPGACADVAGG